MISQPFFNIEVNQVRLDTQLSVKCTQPQSGFTNPMQVCIPGLHISLGVFYRLYGLLEEAAHELDLLIAITLGRDPSQQQHSLPGTFQEYVQLHRTATAVTEEVNELSDHADFCDSLAHWSLLDAEGEEQSPQVQALRLEAQEARKSAEEMEFSHSPGKL